jgi:hypothetical protein
LKVALVLVITVIVDSKVFGEVPLVVVLGGNMQLLMVLPGA